VLFRSLAPGNPLVSVGRAILVAPAVPQVVDPWLAPRILDAEAPLFWRHAFAELPVLPAFHEIAVQGVHVAHAGHVPVFGVLDVEVKAEGADVFLTVALPVLSRRVGVPGLNLDQARIAEAGQSLHRDPHGARRRWLRGRRRL